MYILAEMNRKHKYCCLATLKISVYLFIKGKITTGNES